MIESFLPRVARGVMATTCMLSFTACGAVANEQGADADAGHDATVVTGEQTFDCTGDEGPNELGVSIDVWSAGDPRFVAPGATLRWTNCAAPILTFSDDHARAILRFGHPEQHAPVVEGPGLLPTVGGHLFPAAPTYPPGLAIFAPALDAATFASTVPLRDDAATLVVLYGTNHADDPTCGSFEGLQTTIAEHPELVATSHPLLRDAAKNTAVRYDVVEGLPPGETIHVLTTFPKCAVRAGLPEPPPLLAGHAHEIEAAVGPVGSL